MEKTITIIAGLIFGYFLFKLINKKQKNLAGAYSEHAQKSKNSKEFLGHENSLNFHKSSISDMSELQSNSEHAPKSSISDILTNDKYKVKGQWGR